MEKRDMLRSLPLQCVLSKLLEWEKKKTKSIVVFAANNMAPPLSARAGWSMGRTAQEAGKCHYPLTAVVHNQPRSPHVKTGTRG